MRNSLPKNKIMLMLAGVLATIGFALASGAFAAPSLDLVPVAGVIPTNVFEMRFEGQITLPAAPQKVKKITVYTNVIGVPDIVPSSVASMNLYGEISGLLGSGDLDIGGVGSGVAYNSAWGNNFSLTFAGNADVHRAHIVGFEFEIDDGSGVLSYQEYIFRGESFEEGATPVLSYSSVSSVATASGPEVTLYGNVDVLPEFGSMISFYAATEDDLITNNGVSGNFPQYLDIQNGLTSVAGGYIHEAGVQSSNVKIYPGDSVQFTFAPGFIPYDKNYSITFCVTGSVSGNTHCADAFTGLVQSPPDSQTASTSNEKSSSRKRYAYINPSTGKKVVSISPIDIEAIEGGGSPVFKSYANVLTLPTRKVTYDSVEVLGSYNAGDCKADAVGYFTYTKGFDLPLNTAPVLLNAQSGVFSATINGLTAGESLNYKATVSGCDGVIAAGTEKLATARVYAAPKQIFASAPIKKVVLAPVVIVKGSPEISAFVSNDQASVSPGERYTYQVLVENKENSVSAEDVSISVRLPKEARFISSSEGSYSEQSHSLQVNVGKLSGGDKITFPVTIAMNEDVYEDTASVRTIVSHSNQLEGDGSIVAYDYDSVSGSEVRPLRASARGAAGFIWNLQAVVGIMAFVLGLLLAGIGLRSMFIERKLTRS